MANEYLKLYTDTDIIISGLKNFLEEKNIKSIVKDRFESARLGGFGEHSSSVEIHVLEADIISAKEILTSYKEKINS